MLSSTGSGSLTMALPKVDYRDKLFLRASGLQRPSEGPFNRENLMWDDERTARIESCRFLDFLVGEQTRMWPSAMFYVAKSGHDPSPTPATNVLSYSEIRRYKCGFGPEAGVPIQNNNENSSPDEGNATKLRRTDAIKTGCQCQFEYRKASSTPFAVTIQFLEPNHVDSNGVPCHGAIDPLGAKNALRFGANFSRSMNHWVFSRLEAGLSVKAIMEEHRERVLSAMQREGINYLVTKDDFLKPSSIYYIARGIREGTWKPLSELGKLAIYALPSTTVLSRSRVRAMGSEASAPNANLLTDDATELKEAIQHEKVAEKGTVAEVFSGQAAPLAVVDVRDKWSNIEARLRAMVMGDPSLQEHYACMLIEVEVALKRAQTHLKRQREPVPS